MSQNPPSRKRQVKSTSWKPGQSGNPAGGPEKAHWWTQLYIDELNKKSEKDKRYKRREMVVRATINEAEKGSIAHAKEIGDRVQGKAPASAGLIDDDGKFKPQDHVVIWE